MSNVKPEHADLERLSPEQLEAELRKLQDVDEDQMTIPQLERAIAIVAIARRSNTGPRKAKAKKAAAPTSDSDLLDLF